MRCGVTSRLDKGTSGYLIYAFSDEAMAQLRGGQKLIADVGVHWARVLAAKSAAGDASVVQENVGADGMAAVDQLGDSGEDAKRTASSGGVAAFDDEDFGTDADSSADSPAVAPPLMSSRGGRVWKHYYALVVCTVKLPASSGVISAQVAGQDALTRFKVLKEYRDGFTLVRCSICTGRRHQIRVHMSSIGCPIVNDVSVGGPVASTCLFDGRWLALHLYESSFVRPSDGERVCVTMPLPQAFVEALTQLEEVGASEAFMTK
jgi:hypothetical protein